MASNSGETVRKVVQVVLAIVIAGLAYYLYYSITEPYERIERQRELTELTRQRMMDIRAGMIRHKEVRDSFPDSLGQLKQFIQEDSLTWAARDSIFETAAQDVEFNIDSLFYSPRTGNRFVLVVNDTLPTPTYVLRDPDSEDSIGTSGSDVTRINAPSWR